MAEAAETRRRRLRTRLLWALAAVAAVVVFMVAGVRATGDRSPMMIGISALAGAIVVGSVGLHRVLRRRIGGMTAVLGMSLLGGAFFLALAAAAPQCPDSAAVGRCTGGELANWGMVGMLLPLTGAAMLGAPMMLGRTGLRVLRLLVRIWKGQPLRSTGTAPKSSTRSAR